MSIIKDTDTPLHQRVAARVRELRRSRRLSLDQLAAKSRVSRSMISLIERGRSSPTAVLLEKLAVALGVTLASLFDPPEQAAAAPRPVARRQTQAEWRDPASGYIRRNLSPPGIRQPLQMVEVRFPPRTRVAFDSAERESRIYQQIWLLEGTMEIRVGATRYELARGDCLAMELNSPTMFHNPGRRSARYVVITCPEPVLKR